MSKPKEFQADNLPLPDASIARILKKIPGGIKMGKDAKKVLGRAAGVFVLYATSIANDFCRESRRHTVNPTDVVNACKEAGFDGMVEELEAFIKEMQEAMKKKKSIAAAKKAQKKEEEEAAAGKDDDGDDSDNDKDDKDSESS